MERIMDIEEFINDNKEELETILKPHSQHYQDYDETELWILNDEGLYNWAKSEGVNI